MNSLKKIGALALALVMVLTMGAVAFADETPAIGDNGVTESVTSSITIPKTIDLNGTLTSVYSPNVIYTFSLAPATVNEGTTITDNKSPAVTSVVTAGPTDGASLDSTTLSFTSAETAVATDITQNLTVTTDISKFSKPGVYRYELKDTTTKTVLDAAGITRPTDYTDTYYLDVYVHYNTSGSLEVYGYVLSKGNDSKTPESTDKVGKIDDDKYYTVDVTLTKKVTGAMGDTQHEFPFAITLTNNSLSYYADKAATPTVDKDATDTGISITLKSEETYYLYGLSPLATVIYEETNDTDDTYTLTITGADQSSIAAAAEIPAKSGTKNTGDAHKVSNYNDSGTQSIAVDDAFSAVTFTNNLNEISPTGVVLRVAPYALMLVAGLFLLIVARRRKSYTK